MKDKDTVMLLLTILVALACPLCLPAVVSDGTDKDNDVKP